MFKFFTIEIGNGKVWLFTSPTLSTTEESKPFRKIVVVSIVEVKLHWVGEEIVSER